MIENRRTTVNGRDIVGGRGRLDPESADIFTRIAMDVAHSCRYVEPQFTLRFDRETPEDIIDAALDAIGSGATYPTLYNDDVHIPAVMRAMRVDEKRRNSTYLSDAVNLSFRDRASARRTSASIY